MLEHSEWRHTIVVFLQLIRRILIVLVLIIVCIIVDAKVPGVSLFRARIILLASRSVVRIGRLVGHGYGGGRGSVCMLCEAEVVSYTAAIRTAERFTMKMTELTMIK